MITFLPKFKIATLAPDQDRLLSKIGGLPWGLPKEKWPICCGHPEKLLAQICHEMPLLDLGCDGNVLHLFQCLDCGLGDRGCDAFIIHRSKLGDGLTKVDGWDRVPQYGPALIGEFWLDGWVKEDDGIPADRLADFFDQEKLWKLEDEFSETIDEIGWFDGRKMTRFGGTPRWTGNGPMGFPPPPFEFLFQIDSGLYLNGTPPSADEVGCRVETYEFSGGRSHQSRLEEPKAKKKRLNAPWDIGYTLGMNYFTAEFTNLASDGTLYVFINRSVQPPDVVWFYNR